VAHPAIMAARTDMKSNKESPNFMEKFFFVFSDDPCDIFLAKNNENLSSFCAL